MKTYPCEAACVPAKEEKKYYTHVQVKSSSSGSIFKVVGTKLDIYRIIVVEDSTILLYVSTTGELVKARGLLTSSYKYELLPNAKLLMSIKES